MPLGPSFNMAIKIWLLENLQWCSRFLSDKNHLAFVFPKLENKERMKSALLQQHLRASPMVKNEGA